jgi:hypothetical protein
MNFSINQSVITPITAEIGYAQGGWIDSGILVRLPINKETEKYKKKSTCITPKATLSGLWVFQEDELKTVK